MKHLNFLFFLVRCKFARLKLIYSLSFNFAHHTPARISIQVRYMKILDLLFFKTVRIISLSVFHLFYRNLAKLYIWHHFTPWQRVFCWKNFFCPFSPFFGTKLPDNLDIGTFRLHNRRKNCFISKNLSVTA